jgi:cyclopropane fatty-acyl-phospholipid synthase-like methyltransferase
MPPHASKAPKSYWNKLWTDERTLPEAFTHRGLSISTAYRRGMHEFFTKIFGVTRIAGMRLLEVGCARSQFLPYFAIEHGLSVAGLDYSPPGCEASRQILERAGITGTIHCADLFAPPPDDVGSSDIVASFGVIEHFTDTAEAIAAKSRLAKPGGYVLTTIPNMRGLPGSLQRLLDREIFDLHVPLACVELQQAHTACGLDVVAAGYILPVHLGVCNLGRYRGGVSWRKPLFYALVVASTLLQWLGRIVPLPRSEMLSPYVYVLARKPPRVG